MEDNEKNMAHFLLEANERAEDMKTALKNIFMNTINLEISMYKHGVLANIEMAVGKETYEYWKAMYE